MKTCVSQYLKVMHVLVYLSNTTEPKTIRDIYESVCDISLSNIRIMMNQLTQEGLVIDLSKGKGAHHKYLASEMTIQLYGPKPQKESQNE